MGQRPSVARPAAITTSAWTFPQHRTDAADTCSALAFSQPISAGLPMSHTGLFQITNLTYKAGEHGTLARALQIVATCTACGATSVWGEDEMEHVAGGTVLACRNCGVRQAISNARLSSSPSDIRHPRR
ncbi:hypothetical protein G6F24_015031 [Rhizopus arrhizus]|nr:hypothetical protein G6F24_015031 [Rhizopus arrhizus]